MKRLMHNMRARKTQPLVLVSLTSHADKKMVAQYTHVQEDSGLPALGTGISNSKNCPVTFYSVLKLV